MNEVEVKAKKESSFEILFVDSEDKYETSSSFSSPWSDRQFINVNKSFTVLPEKNDISLNNGEKSKLNFSASLQHLTSSVTEFTSPSCQQSDFGDEKSLEADIFSNECLKESICSSKENNLSSCASLAESDQKEEKNQSDHQLSETQDEKFKQTLRVEKDQNCIGMEIFSKNYPNSIDNYSRDGSDNYSLSSIDFERKRNSDCPATFENLKNVDRLPAKIPKHIVEQIYPKQAQYPERCSILKPSLKIYRWIRENKYLQNLVSGAKSSFRSFYNKFEMEFNTMLGIENPTRILIISNMDESLPFEKAILDSFNGQVIIARCSGVRDLTSPALPVGYDSALRALQSSMNNARQEQRIFNDYNVIISFITFITENVPQRWQMCTALCLEDLNAGLNLHNFSATTPVPNEYVCQAKRLTPKDYPLKEFGLAVTLKEATASMTRIASNDMQEFLSGVSNFETLKQAAKVLVGMYIKYSRKYSV